MHQKYSDWIANNVPSYCLGLCASITNDMTKDFPELRRVRGTYDCPLWGERTHWWCVDESGNIVDPTSAQFISAGLGEYIEWDESNQEPTGKCFNCGSLCFNHMAVCSDKCNKEYSIYCRSL